MKKKRLVSILAIMALAVFCLSLFAACGLFDSDDKDDTPKEYTIQYTDEAGLHTLKVTENALYSLEKIPEKKGHKFLGLFDVQEGGTQYVLANGSSVGAFTDGKNIVLYPQFKADEYTVILDYQDAQVTGERQFSVEYASSLPVLPKDVTIEHKVFVGWFTDKNCKGVKVADKYGLIPVVSTFNENNFDLSQEIIYLYAGFETEKFTVTCYFASGINSEELQVEYNTPISQVVPDTRVDGKAPIAWSKNQGGEPFTGKITSDITLYAIEYAPVIELDVNGGDKIIPLVARVGTSITLPTPTKDLAKFLYWEDSQGKKYEATIMPSNSVSLKAVWQGKLVFDENGGSDVTDISLKAGETVELPTPEREGYIFAGWYTAEKEQYTSTKMPKDGVALKAGWYKEKKVSKVLVDINNSVQSTSHKDTFMDKLTLNFSEYLSSDFNGLITVSVKWKEKNTDASQNYSKNVAVGFYSQRTVSDDYRIARTYYEHTHSNYVDMEKTFIVQLSGNVIYVTLASSSNATGWLYNGYVSDYRYELTYPDTSKLYL